MKVVKFGGSSLANSQQFEKVKKIIEKDPEIEVVVVSAPGKQNNKDHKVTDMLYLCYQLASIQLGFQEVFKNIRDRFTEICQTLSIDFPVELELDRLEEEIRRAKTADFVASRGEYLCAKVMAAYLGFEFLDAKEVFLFNKAGFDQEASYALMQEKIKSKVVLPGFYGRGEEGEVITFSRGGSDISGAHLSAALNAEIYENWTDVSGFLRADPRIVEKPETIEYITFHELRELSYMGAQVLHEEAINPVRSCGIPIHIKNTNQPEDSGTLIVKSHKEDSSILTGVAGKKGFMVINVEKYRMTDDLSFLRKLCSVFEANGVSIYHMPTSVDTVSILVSEEEINHKEKKILEEIDIYCQPDLYAVTKGIAILAIVGEGMAYRPGAAARVFSSLAENKINIRMISQGASEFNILLGVKEDDFDKAVRAIYHEFLEA